MTYGVFITRRAQKELADLPVEAYRRVKAAIANLAVAARPPGSLKLVDRSGWRIRVGDYRVLYTIDDEARTVLVVHVSKRDDAYR